MERQLLKSAREGYAILRKWRKSCRKLLCNPTLGADAQFFVREDVDRPIEVRLRAGPVASGLNNIEIAGEVYRTGTLYRTRAVFVLRLEPASELARKLAKCPGASEHHLTPDLQEEIIVLRNRRGRVSELAPLRAALALRASQEWIIRNWGTSPSKVKTLARKGPLTSSPKTGHTLVY